LLGRCRQGEAWLALSAAARARERRRIAATLGIGISGTVLGLAVPLFGLVVGALTAVTAGRRAEWHVG
jgi:hypothetical protein